MALYLLLNGLCRFHHLPVFENLQAKMALTPTGPAMSLLLVSAILLFFSWVMVILRMTVRIRIKAVGTDDWLMVAGLVSLLFQLSEGQSLY
jgi:hypothetical protein